MPKIKKGEAKPAPVAELLKYYRDMLLIRRFEERARFTQVIGIDVPESQPGTEIVKRNLLVIGRVPSLDEDGFFGGRREKEGVAADQIAVLDIARVGGQREAENDG